MTHLLRLPVVVFVSVTIASAEERVMTVSVPGSTETVIAKSDSKGTIHVLYHDGHRPRYVSTMDSGQTFSTPQPLVNRESEKDGLEYHIWDMAVDAEGRVHVALGNNAWQLKLPKEEWGLFYTRLDPRTGTFENLRNINQTPSEGFSLAANDKGQVTACWMADKLYANVSNDHGQTFGPTVEIESSLDPCDCCTTSCTYAEDGRLAVLYREETNNERDMHLALWNQKDGRTTRSRVSAIPWKLNACPMTYYQISRSRSGFTAVWPTRGRVYFARLDSKGVPVSPIETDTQGSTDTRTSMLALDADDGTLVVWKKKNGLNWQFFDQAGTASPIRGSAESQGKGAAGAVTDSGRFILFL